MSESDKPGTGRRERRREERMSLSLPVRIQGQYPDGATWEDMTSTSDASVGGASVKLSRTVLRGQALFLSMSLPKRYRAFDLTAPTYRVYAVVCSVKPGGELGLRFLGKNPPGGYQRNDSGLFLSPPVSPPTADRRAAPGATASSSSSLSPVTIAARAARKPPSPTTSVPGVPAS